MTKKSFAAFVLFVLIAFARVGWNVVLHTTSAVSYEICLNTGTSPIDCIPVAQQLFIAVWDAAKSDGYMFIPVTVMSGGWAWKIIKGQLKKHTRKFT